MMRPMKSLALLALLPAFSSSFAPTQQRRIGALTQALSSASESTSDPTATDDAWQKWAATHGVVAPKLSVRPPLPEERGKGGVSASEPLAALEVAARIPRRLVLSAIDAPTRAVAAAAEATDISWVTDLTAAAIVALHPEPADGDDDAVAAKRSWVEGWEAGGWATDGADLGPSEVQWGSKCVTGSLLATGSDNDHNIYAKFRFPCHPVVHRAGLGLALLTGADEEASREALLLRGRKYRSMRDALLPLVQTPTERKGSLRERRAWDVADILSRVLSRATTVQLPGDDGDGDGDVPTHALVPLHERLAHCDDQGENVKLVSGEDELLLVATRDIRVGETITRDYAAAPRLDGDTSEDALRFLLQFGLPPNAWSKESPAA